MSPAEMTVDEAQRLRSDEDNERQRREGAEQRVQSCLAQSHCFDFRHIRCPRKNSCQRTQINTPNPSKSLKIFLWQSKSALLQGKE